MIALKATKYLIWDYCLTKLFDGIYKNLFRSPLSEGGRINVEDLKIGMKLSKIAHSKLQDEVNTYQGITILEISRGSFNYGYSQRSGPIKLTGYSIVFQFKYLNQCYYDWKDQLIIEDKARNTWEFFL